MNKRKLGVVLLLLCMVFSMSATAMAATNEVREPFYFELHGGGEKDRTDDEMKRDNANYARVEFLQFYNPTGMPLMYRLRACPNYDPCSNLQYIDASETQRPGYWAGYGINGNYYAFNIQTDSSTVNGAEEALASGIWVP